MGLLTEGVIVAIIGAVAGIAAALFTLRGIRDKIQADTARLEAERKRLEAESKKLQEESEKLQAESESIYQQIAHREAQARAELEERLGKRIDERDKTIATLQEELNKLKTERGRLIVQNKEMAQKITILERLRIDERLEFQGKMRELTDEINKLKRVTGHLHNKDE